MKKIIIANWKMNPASFREAVRLAKGVEKGLAKIRGAETVIAPPFPFLAEAGKILYRSKLGAQDAFWENAVARTGEVSVPQLRSLGVKYVIVGHSERRALGEDNDMVRKKLKAVLAGGLKAVLCVGEKEKKKDVAFPPEVREELRSAVSGVPKKNLKNLLIAYEPIWAIGTGRADNPKSVFEISTLIRRELITLAGKKNVSSVPVLYGGSADERNAADFVRYGRVDGLLVGGASLNQKRFVETVRKVSLI